LIQGNKDLHCDHQNNKLIWVIGLFLMILSRLFVLKVVFQHGPVTYMAYFGIAVLEIAKAWCAAIALMILWFALKLPSRRKIFQWLFLAGVFGIFLWVCNDLDIKTYITCFYAVALFFVGLWPLDSRYRWAHLAVLIAFPFISDFALWKVAWAWASRKPMSPESLPARIFRAAWLCTIAVPLIVAMITIGKSNPNAFGAAKRIKNGNWYLIQTTKGRYFVTAAVAAGRDADGNPLISAFDVESGRDVIISKIKPDEIVSLGQVRLQKNHPIASVNLRPYWEDLVDLNSSGIKKACPQGWVHTFGKAGNRLIGSCKPGTVFALDPNSGDLLGSEKPGNLLESMVYYEPLGRAYFSDHAVIRGLAAVDPVTLQIKASRSSGPRGHFVFHQSELFVTIPFPGKVEVLDPLTLKKLRSYSAPFGGRAIDICFEKQWVAVGALSGLIDVIRISDGRRIGRYRVGRRLHDLAFSPDCSVLYSATRLDGLYAVATGNLHQ